MYTFRFAKDFDFETWEATNGFLHRFCMRYGVLSKHITGESLDCPDYTQFMEEVLTPLLMQYEPQDVYNADETSLYVVSPRFEEEPNGNTEHSMPPARRCGGFNSD